MRGYDLLRPAQLDILDLAEYAGEYSNRARDTLTDTLFDAFDQIVDFPEMGRDRGELAEGLRSFPLNRLKVTVFYFPMPRGQDRMLIARVLRQEREIDPEMFSGGEG